MSEKPKNPFVYGSFNHRVRQAFSLTNTDLDANRAGQMTASQQERLGHQRTNRAWSGCASCAVLIIVGFFFLTGKANNPKKPDSQGTGLLMICGSAVMGLFGLSSLASISDDVHNKRVVSIEGAVKCSRHSGKNSVHYRVSSGAKTFEVPRHIYEAFVDGATYILYYAPSSETLVGAEHDPVRSLNTEDPLVVPSPHDEES